ncbi:hypothetical protein B0H14DRAFT_3474859 [Mycena olivaceomarginata]|nr:hypothetical protein B0H14DRAFT_3474859 [Mycena olivaceomarginata]
MAESDARSPATRSGAIYSSANLLYQLIEEEIPPQQALENTALMQSAESSEKELDALKGILAENGLGVGSMPSGRASLHFIGDRAKLVGDLADEIERFAPEPSQPFSPVSLVQSLAQCCYDRNRRLGAAHWRYTNASAERDHLKRTVALRDATLESETGHWSAERTKLEADLKEEQAKVAALTAALSELRNEEQAINARLLTAQSESRDWEAKYHALETEFDSLTDVKVNLAEQADAAKTELAQWTIKAAAWDADQRQHKDQTARSTAFISPLRLSASPFHIVAASSPRHQAPWIPAT